MIYAFINNHDNLYIDRCLADNHFIQYNVLEVQECQIIVCEIVSVLKTV